VTVSARSYSALRVHPPTAGALAQFAVLATLAVGVGLDTAGWLAGAIYALGTWLLLSRALRRPGVRGWGPANTVTLARLTLAGGVTALVADSVGAQASLAVLTPLAAVALLLDAVDGQVARRTGSSSRLGARFDMEADSILVLVLSVFVAMSLGWWVVAIGAFRYVFVALSWGLPWLRAPLPPRLSRKVVAALQGIVLVVASAGVMPDLLAMVCVGLALALLIWSFGSDIGWLWEQASSPGDAVAPGSPDAGVRRERTRPARTAPGPAQLISRMDLKAAVADTRTADYPVLSER
jgi:phosphatidylglycerophosphate synthase